MIIQKESPPVCQDSSGALRVGQSRVLLEMVIHAFQDGSTPEAIVQRYPTTTLANVYAVIGYYLHHKEVIEAYFEEREQQAKEVRERVENQQRDMGEIRRRLRATQRT